MQFLIAHGADFKAFNPQTGQSLIEKGTDVNALGPDGTPPLDDAALKGQREIVGLLWAPGADPNAKTKKGATILQAAIDTNQPEIAALLRKHGAK